jgi:peptidoglycan hydrolase-like protein with peptidoglycan-binding domain
MVAVAQSRIPSRPRIATSGRPAPSLDDAARGNGLVRRGQSGESVRQLQQQLSDAGFPVSVDGKFGAETEAAVRRFQTERGIKVDGLVGPETMGQLRGDKDCRHDARPSSYTGSTRAPSEQDLRSRPTGTIKAGDLLGQVRARETRRAATPATAGAATLAPANATEREKFDHYAAIVRANGGEVNPNGQATVLGIRGLSRDGSTHDTGSTRAYDDTFVVLTPDGRVRELSGATHPGQRSSTQSPDVTGDGRGDVGMIHPGNYRVVPNGLHNGSPSFHVRTRDGSGRIPGVRDTNQDGRFDAGERGRSDQRGDTLTGVLFHPGGSNAPRSIGCQTMDPTTYGQFLDAVGGPRSGFSFTLVDAYRRD